MPDLTVGASEPLPRWSSETDFELGTAPPGERALSREKAAVGRKADKAADKAAKRAARVAAARAAEESAREAAADDRRKRVAIWAACSPARRFLPTYH